MNQREMNPSALVSVITLVLGLGMGHLAAQPKSKPPMNEMKSKAKTKVSENKSGADNKVSQSGVPASKKKPARPTTTTKADENKTKREMIVVNFGARPSSAKAKVIYGRDTLGTTPFALRVPKGSGFRDVRVVAPGYIPLNTRFHTFKDHSRIFRLVRKKDAHTLLGYKHKPKSDNVESKTGESSESPKAPAKTNTKPKSKP